MRQLSQAGRQAIADIGQRHGFSVDAVLSMLDSVIEGNGNMAQFSHPEFSGQGQWLRGGMVMVSDMFNNSLKARVDGLCNDLSALVASQPALVSSGSFQSQSQGRQGQMQGIDRHGSQQQSGSGPGGPVGLFVPPPGGHGQWWPGDLGWPNSTGAQNGIRYAYFAQPRRLAIEVNGRVTVYDTLDHQIGGFSQQQSFGSSLSFTSQYGLIDVANLPVVSSGTVTASAAPLPSSTSAAPARKEARPVPASQRADQGTGTDVLTMIEKLADLRAKGVLTEEEFASKKAELLGRL
ncbi:MAG TPA: SHOCT domain-containing protein [Burkholderiaceae bacterium]|nr:SHOCT domain-containing protein [Burkholderiaceae bacterium]